MQGIYTYIPESNYDPREYSVAVPIILLLLFLLLLSPLCMVLIFLRQIMCLGNTVLQSLYYYYHHHHHHHYHYHFLYAGYLYLYS